MLTFIPLTRRAGGIQAYKVIHPAARRPATPDPQTHDGYEWLYVLAGRIRLVLGDQDLTLDTGEAAEFDTKVPHWITNPHDEPTELLMLSASKANEPTSPPSSPGDAGPVQRRVTRTLERPRPSFLLGLGDGQQQRSGPLDVVSK